MMNPTKKVAARCAAVLISIAAAISMCMGAAAENADSAPGQAAVTVMVDGEAYGGAVMMNRSVTYVGIREFSMLMGVDSVSWDGGAKTAAVKSDNLTISAKYGNTYIIANGRYLWTGDGVIIKNGTMYVPLRVISKAFDCTVGWNGKTRTATVATGGKTIQSGESYYDSGSVTWLARIIHAEAVGEPLRGKVAVGSVVMNRVASSEYPNTIYGVIFDKKNGVQFTPAGSGSVYCNPGEESIIAAKLCLDGARISESVLFFVNEAIAENTWVSDNRTYVTTVGNHKFFA